MALRKKKNQQDDSEKLQALLQSWDIALPEKEKKPDFPEISENDFPKADFPENQPESKISEPEEKFRKPEIPPELKKESPLIKSDSVSLRKKELDEETEQKFRKIFQEHRKPQKKEKKTRLSMLTTGSPELDKKFKKEAIQYMHGTIRMYSAELFFCIAALVMFGFSVMYQVFICFSVLAFAAAALLLWYAVRWKLTFDGSTNRLSYQSLTCQEIHFHASEIENFQFKSGLHSLDEQIILTVHGQKIRIFLGFPQKKLSGGAEEYFGGFYNGRKFLEYLEFYQALHGKFSASRLAYPKSETSSKEELMQMLAQYQKQIDEKNKNLKE